MMCGGGELILLHWALCSQKYLHFVYSRIIQNMICMAIKMNMVSLFKELKTSKRITLSLIW